LVDAVYVIEIWAQASVAAEDPSLNGGRNGQAVEAVREGLPYLHTVSAFTWTFNLLHC
jgi:hypothetical protein